MSVGVGLLFAVTQDMQQSFLTLFRVSHLTGALVIFSSNHIKKMNEILSNLCSPLQYICAGLVTNLLFKYPSLLAVSFVLNCGCIIVGVIGAILISADVALWKTDNEPFMRMEVLQLCVLGLEVFLSAVLCFWFVKEKPPKSTERST
nr:uncharacterized protein si:ch211-269k10.4 isoform X1 [Nothobranchius furzeri]